MNGLELSEAYYRQVAEPIWQRGIPELMPRLAVGLAGDGSECLGYDDEISRDHDYGPGFCVWMSAEDYKEYGRRIEQLYRNLPTAFGGFEARNTTEQGQGRVGVLPIEEFYRRYTGCPTGPETILQWFYIPEHFLAKATNGRVFTDPKGDFTAIREKLLNFYPEEVRWKKLAARAQTMAQSGQYNYPRAIKRGEVGAAFFALREFVYSTCSMYHLLNKKYMPYYKWSIRSLKGIEGMTDIAAELEYMMADPMGMANTSRVERICVDVREEWNRQGLTTSKEDFLEPQAWELYRRITDENLRKRHITDG